MTHLPGLFPSSAQVQATIAAAVSGLPAGATMAQVATAIATATGGLADGTTIAMVSGKLAVVGGPPPALTGPMLADDGVIIQRGAIPGTVTRALLQAWVGSGSTPTSTSDSTLTGLPSTIVAGQPLSAVTYTPPQTSIYFVLYKVAGAVEEGLRWASGVMPGALILLIPQTAGSYTVRAYDALTSGNKVYESAQFNVTAATGALPAVPTQAADTGATSSGVTMNWTATGSSYRVLARSGVGTVYGSLADTTVSTPSYTFAGLAPNALPRAVIISQNANGYGAAGPQFLSYVATSAGTASSAPGTITFTGPAGPPTGMQVLTALPGSNTTGVALDGNGNMALMNTAGQSAYFAAAGVVPDGIIDVTANNATNAGQLSILFRVNPANGGTFYALGINGSSVNFYRIINGAAGIMVGNTLNIGSPPTTSLGVSMAGNVFTVRLNGTSTPYTYTDSSITANGYFGVNSATSTLAINAVAHP